MRARAIRASGLPILTVAEVIPALDWVTRVLRLIGAMRAARVIRVGTVLVRGRGCAGRVSGMKTQNMMQVDMEPLADRLDGC